MISLNGVQMYVSSTDQSGVVDADTTLHFTQKGSAVFARYSGGNVARGCLVGALVGSELTFRYAQRETSGDIHGGRSQCDVLRLPDGRVCIVEHFTWSTRVGSGTNVFQETRS
jgi:hypothetical protein